jgi:HEPN domain-containing protein
VGGKHISKKPNPSSESQSKKDLELWLRDLNDTLDAAEKNIAVGVYFIAAFCIQQSVEKALKAAIIALKQEAPPKVHNLVRLHAEVADKINLTDEQVRFLRILTTASHETRYIDAAPGLPSEIYTKKVVDEYLQKALPIIKKIKSAIEAENR